jgi:hypothetical protein
MTCHEIRRRDKLERFGLNVSGGSAMPWVCKVCGKSYDQPGMAGPAPNCYETPQCKSKGAFACSWQAPVQQAAAITVDEGGAARLGYSIRHNSHQDTFNEHKTSLMFVNNARTRGISPDGSTHSGGRQGWKGFEKKSGKWVYLGSFQADLQPWPFRVNDAQTPFPRG